MGQGEPNGHEFYAPSSTAFKYRKQKTLWNVRELGENTPLIEDCNFSNSYIPSREKKAMKILNTQILLKIVCVCVHMCLSVWRTRGDMCIHIHRYPYNRIRIYKTLRFTNKKHNFHCNILGRNRSNNQNISIKSTDKNKSRKKNCTCHIFWPQCNSTENEK